MRCTWATSLQIAVGVAEEKLQPALPSNLPADLLVVATMCCDFDPGLRPSFDLIAEELHKVVQQMQVCAFLGRVWDTKPWLWCCSVTQCIRPGNSLMLGSTCLTILCDCA